MKYKAVIFDLDGTLVDTAHDIGFYLNMILTRHSFKPVEIERIPAIVGWGLKNAIEKALDRQEKDDKKLDIYLKEVVTEYAKNPVIKTRIYPGIDILLKQLKAMGIKLAVFSNKAHPVTKKIIDIIFGNNIFDIARGATEDVPKKTDPTGALIIAKELGVDVKEMLYLGDSDVDCITAKNGKFDFIAALWGFRSKKELEEAGALYFIEKPHEFLDFLK